MASERDDLIDSGYDDRLTAPMTGWTVSKPGDKSAEGDEAGHVSEDEARAVLAQLMVKAAAEGDDETVRKIQAVIDDPEAYDEFLSNLGAPDGDAAA